MRVEFVNIFEEFDTSATLKVKSPRNLAITVQFASNIVRFESRLARL